jgi:uncharacterized protein YbjT (DUF2867 family)
MNAMTTTTVSTPLVLGGTGKTGRRVVEALRRAGLEPTVGSRTASEPESRVFDWDDRSTWAQALAGADAAYLCYAPDLAVPGAADTIADLAELAVGSGVRRLVLLSGRGEPEAGRAEDAIRAIAPQWTVVRSAFFAQNFSESFFADGVLSGELALPIGDVGEPFVDADDVAEVATAALLGDALVGRICEVTGPELLSFADAAALIGQASGRAVRFRSVSAEEYADGLRAAGLPEEVVGLIGYLFAEVLDGRNAATTDGVLEALGRPARSFGDYARRAAASGVWA